jgi:hypothetical protein
MSNVSLKYRTFDDLLNEVSADFQVYSLEGMLEPAQLIKIAQKVNYDLGLKIHKTKEVMLDVSNGKVRLPSDFYYLNYATICHKYTVTTDVLRGRHTADVLRSDIEVDQCCQECNEPLTDCGCSSTCPVETCVSLCDDYTVVEYINRETRVYDETEKLYIKPGSAVNSCCPNTMFNCTSYGEIRNGFIYLNIDSGKIYISYEGAMEDDEGNLLVLHHPMINEYYEFALKERILQNLYMNGEPVEQKLTFIKQELRVARNYALTIVNTPDFKELKDMYNLNRLAYYNKYVRMFE